GIIPLVAGWNMIGLPAFQNGEDPAYLDIMTIIDDTANNNSQYNNIDLMKDYTGQAVYPEFNFFGFNTISSNLAYQIRVQQACNLIVTSSLNYGVINFIPPPLLDTVIDNGNNNDNDDVDDQVVTDTTMTLVFNYETIKQLVITPGFIGIHGNTQTFSNVWGIVIEHVLVGNGFLNGPLNSIVKAAEEFGLGPALEIDIFDIFIRNRFDLLFSDLLFAIDKQIKGTGGKHNNNPKGNRPKDTIDPADVLENAVAIINEEKKKNKDKDKNQIKDELFTDDEEFKFDINNSPGFEMTQEAVESNELFFSKHNQIKLMDVFKNTVQQKPEIYNTVVHKIKSFVNKGNQLTFFNRFLFYNQTNLTTLQTPFGQSQNIDFLKNSTCKLFGDDALQAGQQGFNNNEDIYIAFNMTEGFSNINIYDPETGQKVGVFFMGGVRNVYKTITV
ncbi:MAG TPA: hypothetical protein DCM40_14970, partial [Maribacter sp.]|nr:hypothetical protein [Maribacter sp.]